MKGRKSPKILIFDIETTPIVTYAWDLYQEALRKKEDWFMLCYSYKYLGENKTRVVGLPDFPSYKKDKKDDKALVSSLRELLDDADIVITHNGDKFDIRKTNARIIKHGLQPPSAYKKIDTLKIARKYFKFTSNRLDHLGDYLGVGRKEKTGGLDLWFECMAGVMSSWKTMYKYNKQDTILLEDVYLALRPWVDNHPNINIYDEEIKDGCPKCGGQKLNKRGWNYTAMSKRRKYICLDCGGWCSGKLQRLEVEMR